jgi:uncharacterized repeat protein (TIGR01451 family)
VVLSATGSPLARDHLARQEVMLGSEHVRGCNILWAVIARRGNGPMKRIVLLMSVLVTVLVLGVFAIAYAQRGIKDPASDESPISGPGLTAAAGADGGALAASPTVEPRPLPPDPHLNPLRSARRTFPTDGIRTTAVAPEDQQLRPIPMESAAPRSGSGSEEKVFPSRSTASPTAPVDPFGLRTKSEPGPARGDSGLSSGSTKSFDKTAVALDQVPGSTGSTGSASRRPLTNDLAAKPLREKEPEAGAAAASQPATPRTPSPPAGEPALLSPGASSINPVPRSASGGGTGRSAPSAEIETPEASRAGEGTGKPGAKHIDGPQAPQVTIQKTAPPEIQVGRPATFQIKLKNTGPVPAHNVEIRDVVPKGTRLISTSPRANPGVRGELVWALGILKPADEVAVEVQLMPVEEGEIGSVATVSFSADASARTIATKPQLLLKLVAPNKAMIGEDVTLAITITNTGSGIARKVIVDERVPPGLQHASGPELEYEVGDLKPNESRQLELKLTAVQPGTVTNVLVARADVNVKAEDRWDLEVLSPQLEIALEGPKRRFLDREASYVLSVSNPGTAPARRVELVAELPPGLKFVRANNSGQYDDATRAVRWLLEELPIKETGTVELTTIPVDIGQQTLRLRGSAERGLAARKEHPVLIDGIASVMFEVVDTRDPVEVNGETTYEIRVLNQGSKESTNVQITVALPPDLRLVAAEGPTQHSGDGGRVAFEPLPRLAAKANTTYRVRVQGLKPGDQRVRVQLLTDEIRVPITKEESTRVYSDQ